MIHTPFGYWSGFAITKLCKALVCTSLNVSTICSTHLGGTVGFILYTLSTACTSKQKQVVSIGLMKRSYSNVLVLGSLCGVISVYVPLLSRLHLLTLL